MRRGRCWTACAVLVGMTLIVKAASAQGWVGPPPGDGYSPTPPPVLPDGKWFPYAPVEVAAVSPAPPRQPIESWLRKCNIHCWSCLTCPGCGNGKTECIFAFGSCHAFFGQPCLAPPTTPAAVTPYGGPAATDCNCR